MTYDQKYQDKNQQQKKEYQQKTSSTSSTTITRTRACSGDPLIKMHIEQLTPVYTDLFGGNGIPIAIASFFGRLMVAGMEPQVIASAINATAWARFPTPYYMRAILQRYFAEGIMTEQQLMHDQEEQAEKYRERRERMNDILDLD